MTTTKTLTTTIINAMQDAGCLTKRGLVRRGYEIRARDVASNVLRPLIPEGTLGWMLPVSVGARATEYAAKAVRTAAARCSWAGGLVDGTQAVDAASAASAAWVAKQ